MTLKEKIDKYDYIVHHRIKRQATNQGITATKVTDKNCINNK